MTAGRRVARLEIGYGRARARFMGLSLSVSAGSWSFGQTICVLCIVSKLQVQPTKDVVHDGVGISDFRIASPAGWLKPSVGKLLAKQPQRHAMLQADRDSLGETADEPGKRGAFLRHGYEYFAGLMVWIESDRDISFLATDAEFVRQ